MSTDYLLLEKVPAYELFDGRLEKFGVREHIHLESTTERTRLLTDGRNYVWVYIDNDGIVACLSRYGANAPGKILNALADAFDTDIVSEHEPQFWGFNTQEEWDACMEKMGEEAKDEFHVELLKFVRGEPNNIAPRTIGMCQAEIAKTLVEKDPSLLLLENKDKLLDEVQSIYDREHAATITLSPQQMALASMLATHEDDLPRT